MKFPTLADRPDKKPASLTLEQYADFIDFFLADAEYEQVIKQKQREERIDSRFECMDYDDDCITKYDNKT